VTRPRWINLTAAFSGQAGAADGGGDQGRGGVDAENDPTLKTTVPSVLSRNHNARLAILELRLAPNLPVELNARGR